MKSTEEVQDNIQENLNWHFQRAQWHHVWRGDWSRAEVSRVAGSSEWDGVWRRYSVFFRSFEDDLTLGWKSPRRLPMSAWIVDVSKSRKASEEAWVGLLQALADPRINKWQISGRGTLQSLRAWTRLINGSVLVDVMGNGRDDLSSTKSFAFSKSVLRMPSSYL